MAPLLSVSTSRNIDLISFDEDHDDDDDENNYNHESHDHHDDVHSSLCQRAF